MNIQEKERQMRALACQKKKKKKKKKKKVCKAPTWKRNLNMSSSSKHCIPLFCICITIFFSPKYQCSEAVFLFCISIDTALPVVK